MYCLGNERQRGPGENSEFIENPASENLRICVLWAFGRDFLHGGMNAPYVSEGVFKSLVYRFPFSRSIVCGQVVLDTRNSFQPLDGTDKCHRVCVEWPRKPGGLHCVPGKECHLFSKEQRDGTRRVTWRMKHFQSESFSKADGVPIFQEFADRNCSADHRWDPGCRAFQHHRVNILDCRSVQRVSSNRAASHVVDDLRRPDMIGT